MSSVFLLIGFGWVDGLLHLCQKIAELTTPNVPFFVFTLYSPERCMYKFIGYCGHIWVISGVNVGM